MKSEEILVPAPVVEIKPVAKVEQKPKIETPKIVESVAPTTTPAGEEPVVAIKTEELPKPTFTERVTGFFRSLIFWKK